MKRNEYISFHAVFCLRVNRNELRKDLLVVFLDTLYNKMGCYIKKRENTDSKRKLIYE